MLETGDHRLISIQTNMLTRELERILWNDHQIKINKIILNSSNFYVTNSMFEKTFETENRDIVKLGSKFWLA